MNRRDRGILIGMSIGDGCVKPRRKQKSGKTVAAQIQIAHSMKQYDYIVHKSELLRKIFGGNHSVKVSEYYQKMRKSMYKQCMVSKSNPYFNQIYRLLYPYGKKQYTRRMLDMLTPQGIALWYMDDGSLNFSYKTDGSVATCFFRISTYCSKTEADIILNYFLDTYGIRMQKFLCKRTQLWYVGGRTKVFQLFKKLIDKYVIESMRYKLEPIATPDGHERVPASGVCKTCGTDVKKLLAGECSTCKSRRIRKSYGDRKKECQSCGTMQLVRNFGTKTECATCYNRRRRKQKKQMI